MDKQHTSQLEINDLIGDAVNNAVARRSQIDSELSALSDEQLKSVAGGLIIKDTIWPPFTIGIILCPPVIVGLIAVPDNTASIKNVSF